MVYRIKFCQRWQKIPPRRTKIAIKILLKVIKRVYKGKPEIQESIDSIMVSICTEEGILLEQVFFIWPFFAAVGIIMAILEKSLNNSIEDIIFLCKKAVYGLLKKERNTKGYIKEEKCLVVIKKENMQVFIFNIGVLKG